MPMSLLSFSNMSVQILLVITTLQGPALAALKPYIVCLGSHPHDVEPHLVDVDEVERSHHEFLESFLGSKAKLEKRIHYSYAMHVNAFAAVLDEDEAADLARHPDVVYISESKSGIKPRTTRSWEFLGMERNGQVPPNSIWDKARFGEDIIIGNLDMGIWPESPSFNDDGMGPVPSKWRGACQLPTRNGTCACNRKLIGARYFSQGHQVNCSLTPGCTQKSYYDNALDYVGHGTHTLATAGGSFVPGANFLGQANGTAKGGAPRARVAAYKICGALVDGDACHESDVLAGFDAAIADGVDVVSLSIGLDIAKAKQPCEDVLAIASFHAVKRGIVVVAAGGNEGPYPDTITNVVPWMITVGASTIDRRFASYVALGNGHVLEGIGLSTNFLRKKTLYPLMDGCDGRVDNDHTEKACNCLPDYLDPDKIEGKILVCRGTKKIDEIQLIDLGVAGMILVRKATTIGRGADTHHLPTSSICEYDTELLYAYLNSTKNPVGYIITVKTEVGIKPSPVVISVSSRGPNSFIPTILKPDIVGPGQNILAAHTEADEPVELGGGSSYGVPFKLLTGTSMSCPHVAGIAALLKAIHPKWSPAAIRSAIMTTAETERDMVPLLEVGITDKLTPATPFAYGAGNVNPNKAMYPGLVYDLSHTDYLNYLCALGYNQTALRLFSEHPFKCLDSFSIHDFNYPSITVPELGSSLTLSRELKNVGSPGTYRVAIKAPTGVSVSVKPSRLTFEKRNEKNKYEVTLKPDAEDDEWPTDYVFGKLIWYDGKHSVYSPLVVKLKF